MPTEDANALGSRAHAFTQRDYRRMLEAALEAGYSFASFDAEGRASPAPVCLLRHDIDVDLGAAARIAEIEHEHGVRATYFVMLRSPVYNLLGRANHRFVQRILDLGHWLGLHYDEGFYPDERLRLQEWVELEAGVLRQMFGVAVEAVSFHQPGPAVLDNAFVLHGLVNTYDRRDLEGFSYVSDSNMVWRDRPAIDLFRNVTHPRLHLLIHPLWWVAEEPGTTTTRAFDRALLANWRRSQEQMLETERAYGNARVFRIDQS